MAATQAYETNNPFEAGSPPAVAVFVGGTHFIH
jgi:hypothetical protein